MKNPDIIVVGLGAMGAACSYHLARRGVRVLGLERFDVPHAYGSSAGQTRLIRKAYYEHPDYVPLLERAFENWDALSEAVGLEIFHRVGGLYLGPPEKELISGTLQAAADHDLEIETVDEIALRERYPAFEVPEGFSALFEPDAGFVLAERAIEGHIEQALLAGASIRAREAVRSWSSSADGVEVVTERGRYSADQIIFCAGAWSHKVVGNLGVELTVTRQPLGWVWPKNPESFEYGRFPCWAIEDDAPDFQGVYYGFPMLPAGTFSGERGLKLAHHHVGQPTDPETLERYPAPEDEASFRSALQRFLPEANGPILAQRVCLYTVSPDQHFIIDRHPDNDRVTVACGFSGHGFKFASVVGEALADLGSEGTTDLPIDFLRLDRFRSDS